MDESSAIRTDRSHVVSVMVLWSTHADRLDDEALLAAMAMGDQQAGAVFVRRHQRAVYGLAITICRDPRVAEDVAQHTFERVWRHAGSFDPRRGTARVWMLTITRRLCIDFHRTRRSAPFDTDDLDPLLPVRPDAVGEEAATRADAHRARVHLAALPEEQRRVLVLAALRGHTLSEIAAAEGIPLGTAKTRLRTALLRMRELMAAGVDDHA